MSVFKFPGDGNIIFQCKISICDMENGTSPCSSQVPPRCTKKQSSIAFREKRSAESQPQSNPLLTVDETAEVGNPSTGRSRRNVVPTKKGFVMTQEVETRTLNVLLSENIRPENSVKYCDIS
ncbi:hypothetical protein OESDEN_16171 [Oesophagostomum dentatum]|uniref:ZP domain-containing protein n=1 Tax=Oesophagostomum dentatum TaxID=61180 RepID=A0A0B1SGU1_OESDE|nr:hypothetical protein OESDEN_16171 [Oesophagostomum dentatum]